MTYRERKRREKRLQAMGVVFTIISLCLALALAHQLGLNSGYDRGFNACIEENNLYERYQNYDLRR